MNDLSLRTRPGDADLAEPAPQTESPEFLEYWRSITKHRWGIAGLTVLVAVIALLVAFNMRHTFKATATILFEQGKSRVVSIEEVYSQGNQAREYFQTQVEILKSDEMARRLIRKLGLINHPDFDPRQANPGFLARWMGELSDEAPLAASEEEVFKHALKKYKDGLQVQMIRNSQLAAISFVAHDRQLAAKVPNALAEIFIESDLEARMAMTQKATSWMRERLGELRGKVDAAERALQDYRERERIVDAKGLAMSGASRQLEELTKSLVEARAKRAEAEAGYSLVQQARASKSQAAYDTIPAVLRHPAVQRLKEAEGEAERRLGEAGKRYGPEHPNMIKARAELEGARENTRRQIEVVVAGISKEYELARANEAAVERALAQSKADIQGLNRKEFQLGVLEREVQQNRNLYDMFVARLKETSAAGDLQTTIARVVDPATVPSTPHAPNKKEVVLLSALVALLASAMLALLLERLNNRLNSTAGVEQRLGVPALGVLHLIKGIKAKKGFISELAFHSNTQSLFAEAVRTIRTSVLMSALDDPHKTVVVTSSVPSEGKTTVAYNLACALGQVKKVLLIDADMRRPKIHKLLGRSGKEPGLADLVAGQAQISQCIVHQAEAGIHVMAAGTVPPNPLELLSSKRFDDVVDKIKEAFDIVIFDSAPLQLVSDSLILSQHCSAVIYVVKADSTPYQVAQNGLKRLARVGAPVLGVVLNQLDIEKAEKYHGEYSGYNSYKGYKKHHYKGYGKGYGQEGG